MSEIWLRSNRRAFGVALVLPTAGLIVGLLLGSGVASTVPWVRWLGWGLAAISSLLSLWLAWQLWRPRIARQGDELLFFLRAGAPLRVPLPLVEGFLLGQGASYLRRGKPDSSLAATIVIRLADRATDYAQREVKPALGSWCNHYVTIRGTWCEPLSVSLVNQLNQRLAAAQNKKTSTRGRR